MKYEQTDRHTPYGTVALEVRLHVDLEVHDLYQRKGAQFLHQQQQFQGVHRLERQLYRSGFIRLL